MSAPGKARTPRAPITLFRRGARFMAVPGIMAVMGGAGGLSAHAAAPTIAHAGLGYAVSRPDDLAPAPGGAGADLAG